VNDKDGAKMSKSVGNVIDPHAMIEEYGSDTVRLYMTSEVGVGQDLNFSDDRIRSIHNDVLANNYGNLVNRVISLWIAHREKESTPASLDRNGIGGLKKYSTAYWSTLNHYNTQWIFAVIQELLNDANAMLNITEPWKKQGEEKSNILVEGIAYVYYITRMFHHLYQKQQRGSWKLWEYKRKKLSMIQSLSIWMLSQNQRYCLRRSS
jgi:methionyl-tRNA synthetase